MTERSKCEHDWQKFDRSLGRGCELPKLAETEKRRCYIEYIPDIFKVFMQENDHQENRSSISPTSVDSG